MNPTRLSLVISLSSFLALPIFNACTPLQADSSRVLTETTEISGDRLQQIAQAITVRVTAGNNRGSGVLIAKSGQNYTVVTNAHVLADGEPYRVQTPDGTLHEATLIQSGAEDLALLQFSATEDYFIAEISPNLGLAEGEKVLAAGFPYDREQLQVSCQEVSLLANQPIEGGYNIGYTNDIQQGMSGGAILNAQGKLIGINGKAAHAVLDRAYQYTDGCPTPEQLQQMRAVAWGIPIETIIVAPQLEAPAQALTGVAAQVDEMAKQITVLINVPGEHGSGAIIARQGDTYYVLTAAHVVQNQGELQYTVVTHDGKRYAGTSETVAVLPGADLAVVQFTSSLDYQVATLAQYSLGVEEAGWIFLSGFPGGSRQPQRRLTAGKVFSRERSATRAFNLESLTDVNGYGLVYTNLSQGGMSGGAVLDSRGRLIGIHAAAEAERVIQESGLVEFNLGRSLGVPIATFLGVAERANVNPRWLTVETDKPTELTEAEIEAIQDLFDLEAPSEDATAADWLNYGNQLWRAERYEETVSAIDRAIALQPDLYQAYYVQGVALSSQEKAEEAVAAYTKALEINPRFYEALRARSINYLNPLERYSQALADIEQAITYQPSDWNLYWIKSTILLQLFRNEDALAAANEALSLNADHPFAYEQRGVAHSQLGQAEQALADYNRALEINPVNEDAYLYRGGVYKQLQQPQKALADYDRALEIDPEYYGVYLVRALTHWHLEQSDRAFADLETAIALEPELPIAYSTRGNLYREAGENERAIADYTQAIQVAPQYSEAYQGRGIAYTRVGNYEQAITDFTRALDLEPEFANAYFFRAEFPEYLRHLSVREQFEHDSYYFRGYAYLNLQKFESAIADFTKAISINPEDGTSYPFRGLAYRFSGKLEQALTDYSRAIELNKKYGDRSNSMQAVNYSHRGDVYLQLQDYERAAFDFTQAIQLAPEDLSSYRNRGKAYVALQEYDKAITDFTKVLEINPDDAEAYFTRGTVYHKQEDYQQALSDYEAAIALSKTFWQPYVNIGLIKYEIGEVVGAIAQWQTAIKITSEEPELQLALAAALYTQGNQEQGLKMARAALAKDERFADIEFLRENLWGDRLIASAQTLLEDSRL